MPTIQEGQSVVVTVPQGQFVSLSTNGNASISIPLGQPGGPTQSIASSQASYGPMSASVSVSIASIKGPCSYAVGTNRGADIAPITIDVTASTNVAADIQAVLDRVKSAGVRSQKIIVQSAGPITLAAGITLDPYYHDVFFSGRVVTYTPLSGVAITVSGSVPNGFTQLIGGVSDINLRGPVVANTAIGILYTGTAVGARTSSSNREVTVYGFDVGIDFFNYGYLTFFDNLTVDSFVSVGVRQRAGEDAGENISFFGGAISNGQGIAIQTFDDTSELIFTGTSIDYNVKMFDINNGRVQFNGMHFEFQGTQAVADQIKVTGQSSLRCYGGYWVVNTGTGVGPYAYANLVNVVDANSQVIFQNTHFVNHRNTADLWAIGAGQCKLVDCIFFNNSLMPYQMFAGNNLLIDGGGEQTTVKDFWYVQNDATGAGASRLVGASGLAVTTATDQFRTGARSIKIRKGNVSNVTASVVAVAIPVDGLRNRRLIEKLWAYSDASSGVVTMSLYWCALQKTDTIDRPVWFNEQSYAVNFFNGAIGAAWQQIAINNGNMIVPQWATHLQLRIDITNLNPLASVWVDDHSAEAV